jgi:hypothetical protein
MLVVTHVSGVQGHISLNTNSEVKFGSKDHGEAFPATHQHGAAMSAAASWLGLYCSSSNTLHAKKQL